MGLYCETPDPATFTAVWLGKDIEFAASLARDIASRKDMDDDVTRHLKAVYANVNARAMPKFVAHWKDWGTCPAGAD